MENSTAPPTSRYPAAEDKHGLVSPYLRRLPFEEKEHVDDSAYYRPGERIRPNTHQLVKRFLQQVRCSGGYDVDCYPPPLLNSPFMPIKLSEYRNHPYYERVVRATEFAIREINTETNGNYKLVDIEKVVDTRCLLMLLTFTAAEDAADADDDAHAPVQTFQAMVYAPFGKDMSLKEWRLKQDTDAATTSA